MQAVKWKIGDVQHPKDMGDSSMHACEDGAKKTLCGLTIKEEPVRKLKRLSLTDSVNITCKTCSEQAERRKKQS